MLKTKRQRHNPVAIHMHINKGGAHVKPEKYIRRQDKVDVHKQIPIMSLSYL